MAWQSAIKFRFCYPTLKPARLFFWLPAQATHDDADNSPRNTPAPEETDLLLPMQDLEPGRPEKAHHLVRERHECPCPIQKDGTCPFRIPLPTLPSRTQRIHLAMPIAQVPAIANTAAPHFDGEADFFLLLLLLLTLHGYRIYVCIEIIKSVVFISI